jgi:hypothetical protein
MNKSKWVFRPSDDCTTFQHLRFFSCTQSWNRKLPDLTSVRYPHVKRGTYASISQDDISFFRDVLPEDSQVLNNPDVLQGYNTDWMEIVRGLSENRYSFRFQFSFCRRQQSGSTTKINRWSQPCSPILQRTQVGCGSSRRKHWLSRGQCTCLWWDCGVHWTYEQSYQPWHCVRLALAWL